MTLWYLDRNFLTNFDILETRFCIKYRNNLYTLRNTFFNIIFIIEYNILLYYFKKTTDICHF